MPEQEQHQKTLRVKRPSLITNRTKDSIRTGEGVTEDELLGGRQCLGGLGSFNSKLREIEGSGGSSQPRGGKESSSGRCQTTVLQQKSREGHGEKEVVGEGGVQNLENGDVKKDVKRRKEKKKKAEVINKYKIWSVVKISPTIQ